MKIFKFSSVIQVKDYEQSVTPSPFTAVIELYDNAVANQVDSVLGFQNTFVRAIFTGNYTLHPDYQFDMYGIIELDVVNSGGIQQIDQISTLFDKRTDSVFIGLSGDKALLTLVNATTIKVEAKIDYTKLASWYGASLDGATLKVSARLGRISEPDFCLLLQNGEELLGQDNNCIEYEHV